MSSVGGAGYASEELSTRSSWYMLLLTLGAFGYGCPHHITSTNSILDYKLAGLLKCPMARYVSSPWVRRTDVRSHIYSRWASTRRFLLWYGSRGHYPEY